MEGQMGQLEVLIPLGAFAWFSFTAWVIVEGYRRRQQLRMQAEFHSKLLDRMGSAQELSALLNSEGGAKLLSSLTSARANGGAHLRILRAVQSGLVLLSLGVGLFLLVANRPLSSDAQDGLMMFATITTALGVGLILSAAAAYVLSRQMGLLAVETAQPS
jgi:hypothetical protein